MANSSVSESSARGKTLPVRRFIKILSGDPQKVKQRRVADAHGDPTPKVYAAEMLRIGGKVNSIRRRSQPAELPRHKTFHQQRAQQNGNETQDAPIRKRGTR